MIIKKYYIRYKRIFYYLCPDIHFKIKTNMKKRILSALVATALCLFSCGKDDDMVVVLRLKVIGISILCTT